VNSGRCVKCVKEAVKARVGGAVPAFLHYSPPLLSVL
jgi:hypothetical protein